MSSSPPPNGAGDGGTTDNPKPSTLPTTPSGDMLDGIAADTTHLASVPQSALTIFSIDECDTAPTTNDAGAGTNAAETSDDDTDTTGLDDDSAAFGLAQKTNQIMSSYKDYISEIQSDPIDDTLIGGNADAAKVDLESGVIHGSNVTNNGGGINSVGLETGGTIGTAGGTSPLNPFRYSNSTGSNDTAKTNNLRDIDVGLGENRFDTTNTNTKNTSRLLNKKNQHMDDAASFEDFYGELSFHPRRNYRHALLRNKGFQRFVMGGVGFLVLLGVIAGVSFRNNSGSDDGSASSSDDKSEPLDLISNLSPKNETPFDSNYTNRPLESLNLNSNSSSFIENQYKPKWYSRYTGWQGTSYTNAQAFCAVNSQELCPYEAMCPDGPTSLPYGGIQMDDVGFMEDGINPAQVQWSPVLMDEDSENTVWVKVGNAMPTCTKFLDIDNEGFRGKGSEEGGMTTEEITRFVMCCLPRDQRPVETQQSQSSQYMGGRPQPSKGELTTEQVEETAGEQELTSVQLDSGLIQETVLKYHHQIYNRSKGWVGQTYLEAVHFCSTVESKDDQGNESDAKYKLCSYEAICPLGIGTQPIGGTKEPASTSTNNSDPTNDGRTIGMWAPISNQGNEWVQIGNDQSPCLRYTHEYQDPPVWGLTGEGNEGVTRFVICCLDLEVEDSGGNDNVAVSDGTNDASQEVESTNDPVINYDPAYPSITSKYKPQWFHRSTGWNGKTYLQALAFCASVESMIICPFAAICPEGDGGNVYGGYKSADYEITDAEGGGEKEAWAPVMDSLNNWVQVAGPSDSSCSKYSAQYASSPAWGLSGVVEGDGDIAPHVACCELNAEDEGTESILVQSGNSNAILAPSPEEEMTAADNNLAPSPEEETSTANGVFNFVQEKYNPLWFDRSNGWMGTTYDAALAYCGSTKRTEDDGTVKSLMLCPFEAYCPMGERQKPFGGFRNDNGQEYESMWAPVSNKYNWWVDIGTEYPCDFYETLYPDEYKENPNAMEQYPEWGITGVGNEDITRHVMCCDADVVQSVVGNLTEGYEYNDANGNHVVVNYEDEEEVMTEHDKELEELNPKWFHRGESDWEGSSYIAASEYCANTKSMTLCPYTAYCPNGIFRPPFGGEIYDDGPNGSWAPMSDTSDGWVSLSSDHVCVAWRHLYPEPPVWGENGGQEDITRHVLCCADNGVIVKTELEMQVEDKYEPQWFGRDSGWIGATYSESVDFCASSERNMEVCPLDAICPNGLNSMPFGGTFDDGGPDGSWAPISDTVNQWVKVDNVSRCVLYTGMNKDLPLWGIRGQEDVTRHIMCCKPQVEEDDEQIPELDAAWQDEIEFEPQWFDRASGWAGTSYSESIDFCSSSEIGMEICPMRAICPGGPDSTPLGGTLDDGGFYGSWVPVSDLFDEWVKVDSVSRCVLWSSLYDLPHWGLTGEEDATRHIMCCKHWAGQILDVQPPTIDSTPLDTATVTTTIATLGVVLPDVGMHDEMGPHLNPTTSTLATIKATTTTEATAVTPTATPPAFVDSAVSHTLQITQEKYVSSWHDRSGGWKGQSYFEALQFCAKKGSFVPCPYEAICPLGPGKHVVGGLKSTTSYAPIVDIPNGWVSVGPQETCMPYNAYNPVPPEWGLSGNGSEEVTQHIMCCMEPEDGFGIHLASESHGIDADFDISEERSDEEQSIMDYYHPVWYTRRHGYHGTTHQEAEQFCNNIGGKRLCPLEAYCPNGQPSQMKHKALFLDRNSFEGEQWAPISGKGKIDNDPGWIAVGAVGGYSTATCSTYESLASVADKLWDGGDSPSEHKQHVLCCANEEQVDQVETTEQIIRDLVQPVWYDEYDGWNGSSWDNAVQFCNGQGGRELCSYVAYCPSGIGRSVMGGHRYDFEREGELWAPSGEMPNFWIMIGQKYQNTATTCMTFESLEGSSPPADWEGINGMKELKRHIMCCTSGG